jgi:lipopolysaccharide export system permease protein
MVIDRYIATTVFKGVITVAMMFAALFGFLDFVAQLDAVGKANYTALVALQYVLLGLPQRLYELAPSTILLGGLVSLGALASASELVVMRASGITALRIVRAVLQAGMVLALVVAFVGEFLVPAATSRASAIRAQALDERVHTAGLHGFWSLDNNRYVSVQQVLPDKRLQQVNVYELDARRKLTSTTVADSATFKHSSWILYDVRRSEFSEQGVRVSHSPQEIWPELVRPELFDVLSLAPEDMSARDLYQYSEYLEANELDAVEYQLAFWVKMMTPVTCLAMLLIAMPMVFNSTPRSGGTGQRVLLGLMFGIMFYMLNRAANHLGVVYGILPVISATMPVVVISLVSLWLLQRVR